MADRTTGYPSVDKPWLKYYTEEQINAELPKYKIIDYTEKASGSTVDNLNIDKVKSAMIPLPPLAEQKRIVAKLEELLPLCTEKTEG